MVQSEAFGAIPKHEEENAASHPMHVANQERAREDPMANWKKTRGEGEEAEQG